MEIIKYQISGMCPAKGQQVNQLMEAMDLPGAYVPKKAIFKCQLAPDCTEQQRQNQIPALINALEQLGWKNVSVSVFD